MTQLENELLNKLWFSLNDLVRNSLSDSLYRPITGRIKWKTY